MGSLDFIKVWISEQIPNLGFIQENAHHEHDGKPFRYPAGKHGSVYRQEDTGGPSRFLLGMDEPVSLSVLYV